MSALVARASLLARPAASQPAGRGAQAACVRALPPSAREVAKPAAVLLVSNLIAASPAMAGNVFDFNLTMPIMMGQFLLLMVFLDKTWFGPVGKVLDERDAKLRSMLAAVKDNSAELSRLAAEAEEELKAARAEAQARIAEVKAATQKECEAKLAAAKSKVDSEVNMALAQLESEKQAAMANLDKQVSVMADEILKRILPEGVRA